MIIEAQVLLMSQHLQSCILALTHWRASHFLLIRTAFVQGASLTGHNLHGGGHRLRRCFGWPRRMISDPRDFGLDEGEKTACAPWLPGF